MKNNQESLSDWAKRIGFELCDLWEVRKMLFEKGMTREEIEQVAADQKAEREFLGL